MAASDLEQARQALADGHPAEAEAICGRVLAARGDHTDALNLLALAWVQTGRVREAAELLARAVALSPNAAPLHANLGAVLASLGRHAKAIPCFARAIALEPSNVIAINALGAALVAEKRLADARECYERALALDANSVQIHNNLGCVLLEIGDVDGAMARFDRALALDPRSVEAHVNRSGAFLHRHDLSSAAECAHEALRIDPDSISAHWALAAALLLAGDLENGLPHCEWRLDPAPIPRPRWAGEPLDGRTILVHHEGGFGDTIFFARYLPLLVERGARVLLDCQPELARLLQCIAGIEIITGAGPRPTCDVHCPTMSLPRAFGTTLGDVPADVPYLHADPAALEKWRRRLGPARLKVGLAWAGNPRKPADNQRSMPLSTLAPLFSVAGVAFYSLQKGPAAAQIAVSGLPITDFTTELEDFADTAALVSALDLVICVDTAVAHVAAAMARPTWVLLPFVPDWRWMLGRDDSPWYPTLRLFRQQRLNDWASPIESARRQLAEL